MPLGSAIMHPLTQMKLEDTDYGMSGGDLYVCELCTETSRAVMIPRALPPSCDGNRHYSWAEAKKLTSTDRT